MKIYLLVMMYLWTPPPELKELSRISVETMQFKSFQSCEVARENYIPKQFNSFKLLGSACTVVEDQSLNIEAK